MGGGLLDFINGNALLEWKQEILWLTCISVVYCPPIYDGKTWANNIQQESERDRNRQRLFNLLGWLEFTLPVSFCLSKQEGERERCNLRSDHSCQVELCVTEHVHLIYGKGQRREKAITGQFSSLLAGYCCWWGAATARDTRLGAYLMWYITQQLFLCFHCFLVLIMGGGWIRRHHLSHLQMSCWAEAKPGASLEPWSEQRLRRGLFNCLLLCNAKFNNNNLEAPSN